MSKFWLPKEVIEKAHSMLSHHENIDTFVFNTEPSEEDGKTFTNTSVSAMDDITTDLEPLAF